MYSSQNSTQQIQRKNKSCLTKRWMKWCNGACKLPVVCWFLSLSSLYSPPVHVGPAPSMLRTWRGGLLLGAASLHTTDGLLLGAGRSSGKRGEQESLLCGGQGPHGSQVQWCFSNYIPIKGRPQERHFYETQEPLTAAAPRVRAPQQWPPLCGHTCTQTHTHLLGISVHTLGVYLCVSKINGSLLQAD